jgi:hypothetical protein
MRQIAHVWGNEAPDTQEFSARRKVRQALPLSAAASRPSHAAVDQEPPGEIREVSLTGQRMPQASHHGAKIQVGHVARLCRGGGIFYIILFFMDFNFCLSICRRILEIFVDGSTRDNFSQLNYRLRLKFNN